MGLLPIVAYFFDSYSAMIATSIKQNLRNSELIFLIIRQTKKFNYII